MVTAPVLISLIFTFIFNSEAVPKYGPAATRLFKERKYIKTHEAPDFWALMPYYVPQQDSRSCSAAAAVMVVNGLRATKDLTSSDELVHQKGVIEKINDSVWSKGLGSGGHGVSLDEFSKIIEKILKNHGLEETSVEAVHVDDTSEKTKKKIRQALIENEKSSKNFIIANFLQSELTGDPEGAVGHFAPIAAYDEGQKRVLIFDPDRQYYEPYWVSEETLLKGMNTKDSTSSKMRGYLFIK